MKDNNIRPYDGKDFFYSDSDEEYEEFLKTVDGKINTEGSADDKTMNDLGKTIKLQGVIDKFRKTAEDIKDASKKITSDAINKIEDLKKSVQDSDEPEQPQNDTADDSGIVMDIDDIKKQITSAVEKSLSDCGKTDISNISEFLNKNDKKMDELASEYARLHDMITGIEVNSRSNVSSAEYTRLKLEEIGGKSEEIRQAVLSISKLSDSIFDLKNAQLNAKKSLENLEMGFNGLKKKCILGITVISILTLISIAMSIIVLLS